VAIHYRSAGPTRWAQGKPWKTTSAELDRFLSDPEIQELLEQWIEQQQQLQQELTDLQRTYELE